MDSIDNNKKQAGFNIFRIIDKATKAVPFVKYALGIAAIVAIVSLVKLWNLNIRSAFWGTVAILFLMTILFVLAKLSQLKNKVHLPATILLWSIVLIFIGIIFFLFTSIFFQFPLSLRKWIDPKYEKANSSLDDPLTSKKVVAFENEITKPDSPILKKTNKEIGSPVKKLIQTNQVKKDTTINAPNALIVTQNQSGGNNTVVIDQKPKPIFNLHTKPDPQNLPVTKVVLLGKVIPREEYNQDTVYYSKYIFDYSCEIQISNFGFEIRRSDIVHLDLACSGCTMRKQIAKDSERYIILISSPENSIYILHLFTKEKIKNLTKELNFMYNLNTL